MIINNLEGYLQWLWDARDCIEATGRREAVATKRNYDGSYKTLQDTPKWLFKVNQEISRTINEITKNNW